MIVIVIFVMVAVLRGGDEICLDPRAAEDIDEEVVTGRRCDDDGRASWQSFAN